MRLFRLYLVEVFVRSKAAWGGGVVIIGIAAIEHFTGKSLSWTLYAVALLIAVIFAQFWHGFRDFKRLRPRIEIGNPRRHPWNQGGCNGCDFYVEVTNTSNGEALRGVRAELISLTPDVIQMLPVPLHVKHETYNESIMAINPGSSRGIDLVTGPVKEIPTQPFINFPHIVKGAGPVSLATNAKYRTYFLTVRISAENSAPAEAYFEVSVEDGELICRRNPSPYVFGEAEL